MAWLAIAALVLLTARVKSFRKSVTANTAWHTIVRYYLATALSTGREELTAGSAGCNDHRNEPIF